MIHLAYKNLISKPLNTVLSVLLLLLSITLATFILQIRDQFSDHLENNIKPFDMVVGAKGSPLQLLLSSVLHIDNPTGNIPFEEAMKLVKNPMVKDVIPVSYGDNYKGFRILGTTNKYLRKYNADLLSRNDVTAKFSDYNKEFHSLERLRVTSVYLDLKTPLLVIKRFNNKAEAMAYYNSVMNGTIEKTM